MVSTLATSSLLMISVIDAFLGFFGWALIIPSCRVGKGANAPCPRRPIGSAVPERVGNGEDAAAHATTCDTAFKLPLLLHTCYRVHSGRPKIDLPGGALMHARFRRSLI